MLTALLLSLSAAPAQSLPPNFEVVPVASGFDRPVGLAFTPKGGMLIIEQRGRVLYHDGKALQSEPFLDIEDEVNSNYDRGLLGIALHPGWVADGGPTSWVYLAYTVSPTPGQDPEFSEDGKYSFSRLTRYKATTGASGIVAVLASRHILLGNQLPDGSVPDCIASLHNSHSLGSLHFADDGSLLVATGDGAHWDLSDTGGYDVEGFDDYVHPVTGLKGPTPVVQDSGSFRAQDPRSLAGKILRLNPENGDGYPSNPFFDGKLSSNPSRVWALGLRNPFRIVPLPGTGASSPIFGQPNVIAVCDVGHWDWEELDLCIRGENFGWPCYEGPVTLGPFQQFNPPDPEFPNCNTELHGTLTAPSLTWNHTSPEAFSPQGAYVSESGEPLGGFVGLCGIGGAVYQGGGYPDIYDGRVFFADWGAGWIKTAEIDLGLKTITVKPFAESMGKITAIASHPVTGDLHYIETDQGTLKRIRANAAVGSEPYGCGVNPPGSLTLSSAGLHIGSYAAFTLHNPLGTQAPGAITLLGIAGQPAAGYPCGLLLAGFGMAGFQAQGELLISFPPAAAFELLPGPIWWGEPATMQIKVPYNVTLVGNTAYAQALFFDPTAGGGSGAKFALTEALAIPIQS